MNDVANEQIKVILATDCGSTTSKARLFKKIMGEYRYVTSGEAPTTVEAPYEDVTFGIRNAIREIEELTGHKILSENGIMRRQGDNEGVDLYVTTSSAGGGLQMMCTGVIRSMTAESSERAALGAGAIIMDVMAIDDGRPIYEKIQRIRALRPDMILLAGGTDGGNVKHVSQMAETILAADPKARFGMDYSLPIVYAGNTNARNSIRNTLKKYAIKIVDNIRSTLEEENTGPARAAIHELFMEHVMSHAPGYAKLMNWTPIPIMPTPAAEGMMFKTVGDTYNQNVIGVGLGGATTNLYSVFDKKFVRTVSANLGMSYSIGNVLKTTGIDNIIRWIPFEINETDLRHRLYNKMIRPTIIPHTLKDMIIEHAIAREAIRLGFQHHKFLARPLKGAVREKGLAYMELDATDTYMDLMKVNWIGGTGGLLSHAPRRIQSALMLSDSFEPEGITMLAQDSVFMIPHLGVLSTVHQKAAMEIFEKDCLIRLGTSIAPKGQAKYGVKSAEITITMPDDSEVKKDLIFGTITKVPLGVYQKAQIDIKPMSGFDIGNGNGKSLTTMIEGGVVGIILDARGRPLILPENDEERRQMLSIWMKALNAYPNIPKQEEQERV